MTDRQSDAIRKKAMNEKGKKRGDQEGKGAHREESMHRESRAMCQNTTPNTQNEEYGSQRSRHVVDRICPATIGAVGTEPCYNI